MFNSEDYTKSEADEKYKKTSSEASDDWPYEFEPDKRIIYNGYEAYTESDSGDRYMGQSPRSNIEDQNKDMRTYIGHSKEGDEVEDLYIDGKGMIRHTALFGSSGYGRGCLLRNILIQTAYNGYGFSYIDPKGDDSQFLMEQIPEDRMNDIVLLQPDSEEQFNLMDAIEEDKIIILDTSDIDSKLTRQLVTERFISEVWTTIKTSGRSADNRDYHLLCVDDFDKVLTDEFGLNEIISQARSFGLSLVLSGQHPSQLPEDVQIGIKQVQNILSFNLSGNPRDPQFVSTLIDDVNSWDIPKLHKFEVTGRIYMDGCRLEPVVFDVYREYPKLRDGEEVKKHLD